MGIITDAIAIISGAFFGEKLHKKNNSSNYNILAISIIILSVVGFFENIYNVQGANINSKNLLTVLLSFFVGSKVGEKLRLEEKLSNLSNTPNITLNAFIDSVIFFGVGGFQISGSILLALNKDSSQLLIKSLIDFPFAIAFGATYGKIVSLSAIPVALFQLLIAFIAYFLSGFFSAEIISQLCAMGYIILFFSGFNLMTDTNHKINNINMLPSIFFVVIFNLILSLAEIFQ